MAKVLLVEDDNNLREIYQARLMAEGYDIVSAMNGEEALVVAKQEQPDLVISDVMMPRISGFEMLDIMRNTSGLKDFKVIMLTALGQAEDKTRADSLGADRYLVKSQVTLEDIVTAAHELLDGSAPAAEEPSAAAPAPETPEPVAAPVAAPQPSVAVTAPTPEPSVTPAPTPAPVPITTPVATAPPAEPSPVVIPAITMPEIPTPVAPAVPEAPAQEDTLPQQSAAPAPETPEPVAAPVAAPQPSVAVQAPEPTVTPAVTAPEPITAPVPVPAPEAIPEPVQVQSADSTATQEDIVEEQIQSFVNTPMPESNIVSSNDVTPLTPPPAPETPASEPQVEVKTPEDAVMAKALENLGGDDTEAAPAPEPSAPEQESAPEAPVPAPETAPETAESDNVTVAHKKIISPIGSAEAQKLGLNELMAKEGLDLSSTGRAVVSSPTQSPITPSAPGMVSPPGQVIGPTGGVDPNSIAL